MSRLPLVVTTALLAVAPSLSACGACGCTLHTDWASQGMSVAPGFRLDLRFDFFNQDQLRSGRQRIPRSSLELPNDQEVQQQTLNRNTTVGLDYSPDGVWGFSCLLPIYDRTHDTIAPGDTEVSSSRGAGLGDVRLLVRYQGFREDRSVGIQVGVKLANGRTKDTFNGGPQAGGALDRGLQLGTGTTDLLLGVFASTTLGSNWGCFAQALYQLPGSEKDGFRPGPGLNVNAGLRRSGLGAFTPQLQLNLRTERPETGDNADRDNSGATLVYLSPGFTVRVAQGLHLSAFVQVPVYQRVAGLQIEPRFLASGALHWAF